MTLPAPRDEAGWRLWIADDRAHDAGVRWVTTVERLSAEGRALHRSKHAATYRWARPRGDVFVKVFRRYRLTTTVKDLFRPSKARQAWLASVRLDAAGFCAPRIIAVGEQRWGPVLRRAWLASERLIGEPVADRIAALARDRSRSPTALKAKRAILRAVGAETGRLHAAGFVAGDLVPANVWIVALEGMRVAFLDHDRTTWGRAPAAWSAARRNLVQLNRVVLQGVTATDRLRVYRAYAEARQWDWAAARANLSWIIAKTIRRRRRCDGLGASAVTGVGFRQLMRADGPFAGRRSE